MKEESDYLRYALRYAYGTLRDRAYESESAIAPAMRSIIAYLELIEVRSLTWN